MAKRRSKEAMPSSNGATRRIYLSNSIYDELLKEAGDKDVSFSELIRQKIRVSDQVKEIVFKEESKK